jgi:hypothetical protein
LCYSETSTITSYIGGIVQNILGFILVVVLFTATLALVVFLVKRFITWRDTNKAKRIKHKADRIEMEARMAEYEKETAESKKVIVDRLQESRHLLTGDSWQDSDGKVEFVRTMCEGGVPTYQWFAIPEKAKFFDGETQKIVDELFGGRTGIFDIECHGNKGVTWADGGLLRVRSARSIGAEVVLGGHTCPLAAIGSFNFFDGVRTSDPCVSLVHLFPDEQVKEEVLV